MSTQNEERHLSKKQKKIISVCALILFLGFSAAVAWFIGKPKISLVSEPEKFRDWVESRGIWSQFIFIGMMIFQVMIALVPGEPLEIGAGYAFGAVEGTILCTVGITLGSLIVFALVRKFGIKLVEVFFDTGKIKKLKFLQNEKRLDLITFIVFFLPGTPKDLLTYFVGVTDIKLSKFLVIASVARLPSVITSTVGGSALGVQKYELAVIVFGATLIISLLGLFIYKKICKHREEKNNS